MAWILWSVLALILVAAFTAYQLRSSMSDAKANEIEDQSEKVPVATQVHEEIDAALGKDKAS